MFRMDLTLNPLVVDGYIWLWLYRRISIFSTILFQLTVSYGSLSKYFLEKVVTELSEAVASLINTLGTFTCRAV